MRAVILGAGAGIAQTHLRAIQAVAGQVVAVQDIDAGRAEALSVPADMAVVVAPHPFHAPLVIAALEAGRHVLVEKPIADNVGDADRMIETAGRNKRLLGVALQHRTRAEVRAAKQLLQAGELGMLQRVDLIGNWPRKRGYFTVSPWRGTWRGEGGGVTINQGQHDLDLLTHLAGPPDVVFAFARTRIQHIQTEDTAAALLEWRDGALGSVHLSTCEVDESQRLELTGTRARLRLLHGRLEVIENEVDFRDFVGTSGNVYAGPPTRPARVVEGGEFDHTAIYQNFLAAMEGREPLVAPAESALATLELANSIVYSSAIGAPVRMPLDRAAYAAFLAERRAASPTG